MAVARAHGRQFVQSLGRGLAVIRALSLPGAGQTLSDVARETGLTRAEVDVRRKQHGYNEVAVQKGHPVRRFLAKFWGLSAWMLELIMLLSLVLRKYSDLAVVSALLEHIPPASNRGDSQRCADERVWRP
jgi:hypothetical protein